MYIYIIYIKLVETKNLFEYLPAMYADWSRPASVRFVNLPVNSKSKLLSYCKNLVMTKIQDNDNL